MPDRAPYLTPPKTAASVRVVPLPRVVVDALAAHLATWPTDGFFFTAGLGQPIRRTAFSDRVWRPAVERAGLGGVTMHALRHFYASLLFRHGESVKTVQARLGHPSAAGDARHLQPSVARLGRPETGRGGRRARTSCGLCAD